MYKKYEIEAIVREYVAMYAEKGEKRTRKAWEKDIQTEMHATKMVDTVRVKTVNLCLEALFARGDATFLDALFAEDDAANLLDPEYRRSFLPENHLAMRGKQAQKWYKVDDAEHLLASWWAYLNTPLLDILDEVITEMVESKSYMDDADLIRESFLDEVRETLGLSNPPTFIDVLVEYLVETFTTSLNLDDFGYDCEGYEAIVWKQFCMDDYGLDEVLKSEYKRELCEIAEQILDA